MSLNTKKDRSIQVAQQGTDQRGIGSVSGQASEARAKHLGTSRRASRLRRQVKHQVVPGVMTIRAALRGSKGVVWGPIKTWCTSATVRWDAASIPGFAAQLLHRHHGH